MEHAPVLLPPTDALTLVCAALADTAHPRGPIVSSLEQTIDVNWMALPASVYRSEEFGDIPLPARWDADTRVQVFSCGSVE